ncbi:NUDIX hydrolase domain-like protein [Cercophora newfieldiana]|uniref:NUDIX hydrolase domain-like protein n=1 Tax=Cercophora newfieldiana TaxID=92897 RepID=A0AA40CJS0_9PEZI|nr:NUDIX hydrolase domain-like protein [Cercophora newfieldiana]
MTNNSTSQPAPFTSTFTCPPLLSPFAIPPVTYLHSNPTLSSLIVSAVVTHQMRPPPTSTSSNTETETKSHVLLIQRAATDAFPLLWECPGGCVDPEDETILHAVQRELFEETGLCLTKVVALLDDTVEFVGKEGRARRITFLVEVEGGCESGSESGKGVQVRLNPEEHADYVWAGVDDVTRGVCRGRKIQFSHEMTEGIVLRGLEVASSHSS